MIWRGGVFMALLVGCNSTPRSSSPAHPSPPSASSAAVAVNSPATIPTAAATAASENAEAGATAPQPCGEQNCLAFSSPEAAFAFVLQNKPRVLALGESHAQAADPAVPSSTRRFTQSLLPQLAGVARHLVLELWVARGNCGAVERQVQSRQQPVTQAQADTNQSEFVALGERARGLGMRVQLLEPSCDEYRQIVAAGPNDIALMLELIAQRTTSQVLELLKREPEGTILAYGGALHNDLDPRPGRERWTFGPALAEATAGRYLALDLIVPEFIKDSDAWRSLPWYAAYDPERHGATAVLFQPHPASYVLLFPREAR